MTDEAMSCHLLHGNPSPHPFPGGDVHETLCACGFVVHRVPVPATAISGKHIVFLKKKAEEFRVMIRTQIYGANGHGF